MSATIPGGDEANLRAMLRAARSAIHRVAGRTRADFIADTATCNAILHRLERIQDGARCISELTRTHNPEVAWSKLDLLRERTRRVVEEGGVTTLDQGILWEIVEKELPAIIRSLEVLLDPSIP